MHALSSPPFLCVTCIMGAQGSQKRMLDCMGLESEVVVSSTIWCWELNSGALEEQYVCHC